MPGNFHTVSLQEVSKWPMPNYTSPPQRNWLTGYAIFWHCLSSVFLAGRIFLRVRNQSGPFGLDDLLLVVGWIFAFAFTIMCCLSVPLGIGRDIWNVRPEYYERLLLYAWIAQVLFICSTCSIKVSVLLFYRRMAKNSYNRMWLYVLWTLLSITVASWFAFLVVYTQMCEPLSVYWKIHTYILTQDPYTCLNGNSITIAAGVLTVISDAWSTVYPWLMFHKLDLGISRRQKIALNVIFSIGLLATGLAVARTYYLWQMGQDQNLSQTGFDLYVTALTECQLGIVCTCAPFLRAFFRRYFPDRSAFTRSNGTDSSNDRSWRNSRWTVRGSVFHPTKPVPKQEAVEMDMGGEKKGFLVQEGTSGRLVFSNKTAPEHMQNRI